MRRIGIVSVSDERPNANAKVKEYIGAQLKELLDLLKTIDDVEPVVVEEPANSPSAARAAGKYLAAQDVDGIIFNVPTFGFPKFALQIVTYTHGPYLLLAKMDPTQPSPAGIAGVGGALSQLGIKTERVWMNLDDPRAKKRIEEFINVCAAVTGLKGSVLGLVGGRSMGLCPMVSSAKQFARQFGVDVDQVDQLEIIQKSRNIPKERVDKALQWLKDNVGCIEFDDILTEDKLREQIKNYEALKQIIKEKEFDFTAVKCHYEMSEYEQPMCIAAMLSNDPYDWDGPKKTHVYACEADEDGAMTMQILKLLSNGKPTCLLDTRYYDEKSNTFLYQNCGIAPSWFAARCDDPKKNLGCVKLCSCVPKFRGGGAQGTFWFAPGEYTLARLYQIEDTYHMLILRGNTVSQKDVPDMPTGEGHWPKIAMKIDTTPDVVAEKLNSVHMHAVSGNYVNELKMICKYLNIVPEVIAQ